MDSSKATGRLNKLKPDNVLLATLAIALLIIAFILIHRYEIRKHGVNVICKVISVGPGGEGAPDLCYTAFYKGKEYHLILGSSCRSCIGKYYYCRLVPSEPCNGNVYEDKCIGDIYLDQEVPGCYVQLKDDENFDGWDVIPVDTCKLK